MGKLKEAIDEQFDFWEEEKEIPLIKQYNTRIQILERTEQQKEDEAADYEYPL